MPRASIDIGSNSLLLLVLDDEGRLLHDDARIVGLGAGLGDHGLFRTDRMDAALEVLRELAATAARLGVAPDQVQAVATSAARRALNAVTFMRRVERETGLSVQIISGEQEARLTWLGGLHNLPLPQGPVAVVDLGGGSTELVMRAGPPTPQGVSSELLLAVSVELGSARLTEQFFGEKPDGYDPRDLARLRDHVDAVLAEVTWGAHPRALIAVGGTATTLACMDLGMAAWDREPVHGYRISRVTLRRWTDRLVDSTPEQRQRWTAVSPSRADVMLAGCCVLEHICTSANRESMLVSDGGVRHGLLMQG